MLHRNTNRILLILLNFVNPYDLRSGKCVASQQQLGACGGRQDELAGRLP